MVPLHWPTQPAPPLQGENPELWVSLAPHLPQLRGGVPTELLLRAAAGTLLLTAADGERWQGSAFPVGWSQEPLAQPLTIQRQVLGPFASHESALQQAEAWQTKGAEAVVAHPADWEVWAPLGSPDPGQPSRLVSETHTESWQPVLDRQGTPTVIEGPLQIDAPDGLRWGGAVYRGRFRLQRDAYGSWTLLQQVPMESYLLGVVPHEIGAGSPLEALKAQTVLARTWAMANRGRFAVDGYHLCSDTQCQVYSDPSAAGGAVRQALASTAGQVLTWDGKALHGVYSASNGGVSSGLEEVWQASAQPYLKPAVDGPAPLPQQFPLPIQGDASVRSLLRNRNFYGAGHPRFRWTRRYSATRLEQLAAAAGSPIGGAEAVTVGGRGPSGRVLELTVVGTGGIGCCSAIRSAGSCGRFPARCLLLSKRAQVSGSLTVVASAMELGCPRLEPLIWLAAAGVASGFCATTSQVQSCSRLKIFLRRDPLKVRRSSGLHAERRFPSI